jgi:hypothetical protein
MERLFEISALTICTPTYNLSVCREFESRKNAWRASETSQHHQFVNSVPSRLVSEDTISRVFKNIGVSLPVSIACQLLHRQKAVYTDESISDQAKDPSPLTDKDTSKINFTIGHMYMMFHPSVASPSLKGIREKEISQYLAYG